MIFFEQFKVPTIKFGKCFAELMISIAVPEAEFSFGHLKQDIQEFHKKYVLVPDGKAANNVAVVCRLHYINTLKGELNGTKSYNENYTYEKTVFNSHKNEFPVKFFVCVKERQDRPDTMYWAPKLYKRSYKARVIANSSSCTTTALSKLVNSPLTTFKSYFIRFY